MPPSWSRVSCTVKMPRSSSQPLQARPHTSPRLAPRSVAILNRRPIGSSAVALMNLAASAGVQRSCSGGFSGSSSMPVHGFEGIRRFFTAAFSAHRRVASTRCRGAGRAGDFGQDILDVAEVEPLQRQVADYRVDVHPEVTLASACGRCPLGALLAIEPHGQELRHGHFATPENDRSPRPCRQPGCGLRGPGRRAGRGSAAAGIRRSAPTRAPWRMSTIVLTNSVSLHMIGAHFVMVHSPGVR